MVRGAFRYDYPHPLVTMLAQLHPSLPVNPLIHDDWKGNPYDADTWKEIRTFRDSLKWNNSQTIRKEPRPSIYELQKGKKQ